MKILKQHPENLTKKEIYKLTKEDSYKMSDCEGQTLQVDGFILYEDVNAKGEEVTLLSVLSGDKVYSTLSNTFIDKFIDIDENFRDEGYSIEVKGGTSKSGRHYITCSLG